MARPDAGAHGVPGFGALPATPGALAAHRLLFRRSKPKEKAVVVAELARNVGLTPKFSCKHTITIAAKPHPKSACLLQRSLGRVATYARGRASRAAGLVYSSTDRQRPSDSRRHTLI